MDKECENCTYRGYEPDNDLFCVNNDVLIKAQEEYKKPFPYGLVISDALPLCKHDHYREYTGRNNGTT